MNKLRRCASDWERRCAARAYAGRPPVFERPPLSGDADQPFGLAGRSHEPAGGLMGAKLRGNGLPCGVVQAGVMPKSRSLFLGIAVTLAVAACGSATTDASDAGETTSCFFLSLTPTPTSGGSFEASVQPRSRCEHPGELLGGLYLELREGDRTVAYLETPNKVLPGDNTSFKAAGVLVDSPRPFKLPELNEGRYTLCSTFSTASDTNEKACSTFEIG